MKKINLLKGIALSVSALMVFSLSGCEYLDKITGGDNNDKNNSGGNITSTPPAVYITQSEISLSVGDTILLEAVSTDGSAIIWESSSPEYATVEEGLVTGLAVGETTIMASTASVMATCTIKVNPALAGSTVTPDPETLVLALADFSLEVGGSVTLTATSSVAGATVKWSSSNPAVASVTNGKVTAKTAGTTKITAAVGDTKAVCQITVIRSGLPADSAKPGYNLVWYDEFDGSSLDTTKWGYQYGTQDQYGSSTGAAYWGNSELQYYNEDAVSVSGGSLKITAKKQQQGDRPYTSGRILTRDKFSRTYGYFEAKMKTPTGNGMWPAFWMLPQPSTTANSDNIYGGWPNNGEIDIMEAKGRLGNIIDTTIHFGKLWPENQYITNTTTFGNPTDGYALSSATDNWHVYAVDWTKDAITWYADGEQVFKVTSDRWWTPSSNAASAPFDQPFYILLNLAVGGGYDGGIEPDYATFTSATMEVDYVRVYEKQ
ncbi:MAG: family 16 glycosylhydrolase [Clostridia bacterium]|nr:family 16 glycosylhydrolase [Clostridia bacterium]